MSQSVREESPIAISRDQAAFLRRLSRISAGNVVRESAPKGAVIGRVHSHVTVESDPRTVPNLRRKRTQPVGSMVCVGLTGEPCEKIVSSNKGRCRACTEKMESQENEAIATC